MPLPSPAVFIARKNTYFYFMYSARFITPAPTMLRQKGQIIGQKQARKENCRHLLYSCAECLHLLFEVAYQYYNPFRGHLYSFSGFADEASHLR